MTVHARNDVASVSISDSHGGCGETHSRPVVDGAPAKNWSLACPKCEDFLRSDPRWSAQLDSVPETPDEITAREEKQKRTDVDTQRMMSQAVTALPEILSQMVAGNAELVKQFINLASEKGTLPHQVKPVPGEVLSRAHEVESADSLSSLSVSELRSIAKIRGIPVPSDKRDKASLLVLLKGQ